MKKIINDGYSQKEPLSTAQKYFVFTVIVILLSVGQFTNDIYLPSIPSLITYFSTTENSIQLTITLYFIGYGVSQLFYGPLSDYYGRRPVILISLCIYLLGTVLCLSSHNVNILLLGRILQGAGIGGAGTIATAIPHDIFSGKKITQAFSCIGIAMSIAPLIAPVLGGYLQVSFGWKASFIFLLIYALIFLLILIFFLPETNSSIRRLTLSPMKLIKTYLHILSNKSYVLSLLCLILTLLGEILFVVWMPIILQVHFKISPIENGWLMTFPALSLALGSILSSFLDKFLEKEIAVFVASIITFMSVILLCLVFYYSGYSILLFSITMSFYMVGTGIIFPSCISLCTSYYPTMTGTAGSLMSAMLVLGAGLWGAFLIKFQIVTYSSLPKVLLISSTLLLATAFLLLSKQFLLNKK